MTPIDWIIILAYFVFLFGVGFFVRGTASTSMEGFFSAGRGMSWWLIGVSLVATTFAADTPLVISGWVSTYGIAGNWFWWGGVIGQVALTVFFARKWRTSGVVTDVELTELRYGGKPALVLRTTKAAINALLVNIVTLGWVFAAMRKIVKPIIKWGDILPADAYAWLNSNIPSFLILKDLDNTITVVILVAVVVAYVTIGGLKAVMITDFFQFGLALFCAYLIAWVAINNQYVDGLGDLWAKLKGLYPADSATTAAATDLAGKSFLSWEAVSSFIPSFDAASALMPFSAFVLTIGVLWWTNGAIDGSGYTAQRLNTGRTPSDAENGSYLYTLLNFCLRHWPWVVAGLAALVIFPRHDYDLLARQVTQCKNAQCEEMVIPGVAMAGNERGVVNADNVKLCFDNPAQCKIRGFEMLMPVSGSLEADGLYPLSTTVPALNACLKDEAQCSPAAKACIAGGECAIPGFASLKRVDKAPAEAPAAEAAAPEAAPAEAAPVEAPAAEAAEAPAADGFAALAAKIERYEEAEGASYPQLTVYKEDREMAYPLMIATLMGPGFLGLALASLMAAFMSTVASQINWGASYLTNDFYYRLIDPKASQKRLVVVSRVNIVLMTIIAVFIANQVDNIGFMWELWGGMMAGMGLPHIMRWLWWRSNAWTEIVGMVVGVIVAFVNLALLDSQLSAMIMGNFVDGYTAVPIHNICFVSLFSGIAAIVATFATKPVPQEILTKFAEKVEPMGWWKGMNKNGNKQRSIKFGVLLWLVGTFSVYGIMFGLGFLVRLEIAKSVVVLLLGIASMVFLVWGLRQANKYDPASQVDAKRAE